MIGRDDDAAGSTLIQSETASASSTAAVATLVTGNGRAPARGFSAAWKRVAGGGRRRAIEPAGDQLGFWPVTAAAAVRSTYIGIRSRALGNAK